MINLSLYQGKSKKTNKAFECLKLDIGEWSTLVFPKSKFELEYIKKQLEEEK